MSSRGRSKSTDALAKLYSKVASKILIESLNLKKGESIAVETWNNGLDFARQLVIEARKLGAIPLVVLEDEEAYVQGVKTMDKEMLGKMGRHEFGMLSGSDAYVFIPGHPLSSYYGSLSNQERSASIAYNSAWYEAAEKAHLRGVRMSFGYVTKEMAKILGKPQEKIIAHQLKAIVESDLQSISSVGKQIAQLMQDGATCSISSSDGSKLEFQLRGNADLEDGIIDEADVSRGDNMCYLPPGFVSQKVDPSLASGRVKISATTRVGVIKDATLEFESGRLVRWESKSSKKALETIVQSIEDDSRKLGTLLIGLNPALKLGYGVDRFVSGSISLNVTSRLGAVVQKGSLSIDDKEIVSAGRLVLKTP
jgi:leucyl aminopeptidase (aminopeptidase T)